MNFLEKQIENPVRFALIKRCFYGGLAAVVVAEIVVLLIDFSSDSSHHSEHFWFEKIPAWSSLYGFVSCWVIIFASKFLGKAWLSRGEDYYDL